MYGKETNIDTQMDVKDRVARSERMLADADIWEAEVNRKLKWANVRHHDVIHNVRSVGESLAGSGKKLMRERQGLLEQLERDETLVITEEEKVNLEVKKQHVH